MSSTGEKEWYFYCTRERKYPNSTKPNRVAVAGFWKATGIDKPIYSSNNGKTIIGLKKSLVFYKGRAAKAFKTEWMMHEFRLPTANNVRPNEDSWTICRVLKKTTVAQRNLQDWRSTYIHSVNSIAINSVRQELPSNEAGNQTSSSSNLGNNFLANDQCCSNESHPPGMIGHSKIYENSRDRDTHLSGKSASFQGLEVSQDYFNRDQMSHFDGNCMQVRMSPHIIDLTGYKSPCLDHKIHQLNFEHDEQTSISESYADHTNVDFHENMKHKFSQGSSSGLNYLLS